MKKVWGLNHLQEIADSHGRVFVPTREAWRTPRPAAFMMSLSGVALLQAFDAGMYIYEKQTGRGKNQ